MSDDDAPVAPRPHGRRARRLTPEEAAERQALAAQHTDDQPEKPSQTESAPADRPAARGAVAPPTADAPLPKLRRFGKRARIVEVDPAAEDADPQATEHEDAQVTDSENPQATAGSADQRSVSASSAAGAVSSSAPASSTRTIERDADGVELGELSIAEATDPRPAPRFDGRVLSRPEQSGGKPLLWIVWAVVAVAIVVLVILLASGVLGPGSDQAQATAHHIAGIVHSVDELPRTAIHSDLEVTAA